MADRKRKRGDERPTARPATVAAVVPSPWLAGKTDRVERVLDSVLALRRAGRITADQYAAAEQYRAAYDTVRAGPGGAMDPSKSGGGGGTARTPSTAAFDAGLRLREATWALEALLVPVGARVRATVVVEMVVGQGWTLEGAAAAIHGIGADGRANGRKRAMVAGQLRDGLDALAALWGANALRRSIERALGG